MHLLGMSPAPTEPKSRRRFVALIAAGIVLLVLVGVGVYGLLTGADLAQAVELGAAHGALAMTTPGDTSMVRVEEVEAAMKGKGARVIR